ncbi:MAG: hypothetical protein HC875_38550 [Anaerolineales bacterium]|nr:hypothetical protein [Anaerolineales bacterium]
MDRIYTSQYCNGPAKKPFFLKWSLSKIAEVLNQRQVDYHINADVWLTTQVLFLSEPNLRSHFDYIWNHTTASQQKILSLIAPQVGPYYHPTILDNLREKELIEGDQQSLHLSDDLTRLEQLGCLYVQTGRYTFTSGCLQDWIKKNKPLD